MSESNLPAIAPATLPTGNQLENLLRIGDMLVKSGLLPQTLRTKEAAAVVVMKGNELGLPPMAALEGISVVQGRTVINAHLMLALVKRAYGPASIWVSETSNDHCTISYRIPGMAEALSYTYTMADARTAGLADKPTWRQHPAAMLRARAISATVKLAFPEVVGGMYVPGEIEGTEETVTPDGDVVIRVSAASVVDAGPSPVATSTVAEVVDIQTGEIVAPAAPERPARASSRRSRQAEPEPQPQPAQPAAAAPVENPLRTLGEQALALAVERNLNRDQLIIIGEEVTEKPRADWDVPELEKLVAHLRTIPIPQPAAEEVG